MNEGFEEVPKKEVCIANYLFGWLLDITPGGSGCVYVCVCVCVGVYMCD